MRRINDKTKDAEMTKVWYRTYMGVAFVGGILSFIVFALLLINNLQIRTSDPLNSEELTELKASLLRQPENESIKEQIRELDLQLREEYFRRRRISGIGVFLMIGSILILLTGAKFAAKYREKLPMPGAKSSEGDEDLRNAKLARRSVGIFALVVLSAALVMIITDEGPLYRKPGVKSAEASVQYPTAEEIKKNWPRFRGPGGLGISAYTNIPSSWNVETGEGIRWKSAIPLPGENSPVVWGDRVFLTGATKEKREFYCFDANSGDLLWQKSAENIVGSPTEVPEVSEETGFAAPTAVTDGQRVYAIFANGDIACFDYDGNQVWARNLGLPDSMYGYASSLAMSRNIVVVLYDQGGAEDGISEILGLDAVSGQTVWRTPRPVPNSWSSPIIIDASDHEEVIASGNPWVIAYEPATGKELWRAECLSGDIAPSPVYGDGLVFATNTYAVLAAIRPGGEGNVTETHIVWTAEDGLPDICSPMTNGELVFLMETYGNMTCYDAKTGEKVWEEDLSETFEASPSLVGDKIYLMTGDGILIIVRAGREFEEISRCELGEATRASPAFLDGRIYIRAKENLYCIENVQK